MFNKENDISIATSTLVKITIFVLVLFFAWTIRDILILLLIAITLASALEPLADVLSNWRIPRSVSVLAVYVVAIGLIVLLGFLVVPAVVQQFQQLGNKDFVAAQFQNKVSPDSPLNSLHLADFVSKNVHSLTAQFTDLSSNFFSKTLGVFNGVVESIVVLVIAFYLLAEKNGMKNFVYTFVPKEDQPRILHLVTSIQKKIGLWLIGQIIVSAIVFSLVLIALTLLNVKYALVIALLSGFFELIPYLGPIISAIPAAFFAFLQSPTLAVIVIIFYVLVSKFEGYVLVPKVMQKTIGVSPLVILVAILVGFKLAGIFGVLLAVPVVAALNVLAAEWHFIRENSIR